MVHEILQTYFVYSLPVHDLRWPWAPTTNNPRGDLACPSNSYTFLSQATELVSIHKLCTLWYMMVPCDLWPTRQPSQFHWLKTPYISSKYERWHSLLFLRHRKHRFFPFYLLVKSDDRKITPTTIPSEIFIRSTNMPTLICLVLSLQKLEQSQDFVAYTYMNTHITDWIAVT